PAFEEVGEDAGVLVAEPLEDLREVGFQRVRDAIGYSRAVMHEIASRLDQSSERTHLGAFRLQSLELVSVPNQKLERDLGVSWVVLGSTGREGSAIARERRGLDRKKHEDVVLEERRHDGPLTQLQADCDRSSSETLSELLGPCPDGPRAMLENQPLTLLAAGN